MTTQPVLDREVKVLNLMRQWKSRSAYNAAAKIPGFDRDALGILWRLAHEFGDCGKQDGNIFEAIPLNNHKVASLLGYTWSSKDRKWSRIEP